MFDLTPFADEDLDPRRTTRTEIWPAKDAADSLVRGDLLLVDISNYAMTDKPEWCSFLYSVPGSASVYPYKVQIPGKGVGQYRAREVLAWARPVELHRRLVEELS